MRAQTLFSTNVDDRDRDINEYRYPDFGFGDHLSFDINVNAAQYDIWKMLYSYVSDSRGFQRLRNIVNTEQEKKNEYIKNLMLNSKGLKQMGARRIQDTHKSHVKMK